MIFLTASFVCFFDNSKEDSANLYSFLIKLISSNLDVILIVCGMILALVAVLGEIRAMIRGTPTTIAPGKGGRIFGGILGVLLIGGGIWFNIHPQPAGNATPPPAQSDSSNKVGQSPSGTTQGTDNPPRTADHISPAPKFNLDPHRTGPLTDEEKYAYHVHRRDYEQGRAEKAYAVSADGHNGYTLGQETQEDAIEGALLQCRGTPTQYPASCRIILVDDEKRSGW